MTVSAPVCVCAAVQGVFRNHMVHKGTNRHTAWFAMTVEDWEGRDGKPGVHAQYDALMANAA